jgi:hypothetical protein
MGGPFINDGRDEKQAAYKILVGKPEGKHNRRWEDNIKNLPLGDTL